MVRFVACLLLLSFSLSQGRANLASELVNRTITRFLSDIAADLHSNQYRDNVIKSVIELAQSQKGCLQTNTDGKCLWKVEAPGTREQGRMTKRDVPLYDKKSTRFFVANFLQNLAKKSFPLLKNHIVSVFSNDSTTLLPTAADTVKRIEVATNLILIRSIQKIQEMTQQMRHLRVPMITITSILVVLVMLLVISCVTKQITEIRIRRDAIRQRKLESYFARRTLQQSMNRSPSYEQVNLQME